MTGSIMKSALPVVLLLSALSATAHVFFYLDTSTLFETTLHAGAAVAYFAACLFKVTP